MEGKGRQAMNQMRVSKSLNQNIKDKVEKVETDNWDAIKRHPMTKAALVVSVTIGLLYVSSYLLDAAAKAATSFKNLQQAIKR